jgi:hypothetical protein
METRSFVEVSSMVRVFPLKFIKLHVAYTLLMEKLAAENRDALDHKKLLADMKIKYTTSRSSNLLKTETCSYMFLTFAGMVSAGGRLGSILLEGDQPRNCKYNLCPKNRRPIL